MDAPTGHCTLRNPPRIRILTSERAELFQPRPPTQDSSRLILTQPLSSFSLILCFLFFRNSSSTPKAGLFKNLWLVIHPQTSFQHKLLQRKHPVKRCFHWSHRTLFGTRALVLDRPPPLPADPTVPSSGHAFRSSFPRLPRKRRPACTDPVKSGGNPSWGKQALPCV